MKTVILTAWEEAAILRGLNGSAVAVNAAERQAVAELVAKMEGSPLTLDSLRRKRRMAQLKKY